MPINPTFLQAAQTWNPQQPPQQPPSGPPTFGGSYGTRPAIGSSLGQAQPIFSTLGTRPPVGFAPAPQGWNPDLWSIVQEAIISSGRDPNMVAGYVLDYMRAKLEAKKAELEKAIARGTTEERIANVDLRLAAGQLVADPEITKLMPVTPEKPLGQLPAGVTNRADVISGARGLMPASELDVLLTDTFGLQGLNERERGVLDAAYSRTNPPKAVAAVAGLWDNPSYALGMAQLEYKKEQDIRDFQKAGLTAAEAFKKAQDTYEISVKTLEETIRANKATEQQGIATMEAQARNWQSQNMLTDINQQRQMYQAAMPYMLPQNTQYYPGFEPGNPMSRVLQGYGMPTQPSQVSRAPIDPFAAQAALAWR